MSASRKLNAEMQQSDKEIETEVKVSGGSGESGVVGRGWWSGWMPCGSCSRCNCTRKSPQWCQYNPTTLLVSSQ